MEIGTAALEKPLPKPRRDVLGYASARVLEALLESLLALEFLEKGYTRNAAGKAFQAWRALTGALLALAWDELVKLLSSEKDQKWIIEQGMPRIPSSRLKPLARLVEEALNIPYYSALTDKALDLHDYQYHGPDPAAELSKYPDPGEAARDILYIVAQLIEIIKRHAKPRLEQRSKWVQQHSEALRQLGARLEAVLSARGENK